MKKLIILIFSVFLLFSCKTTKQYETHGTGCGSHKDSIVVVVKDYEAGEDPDFIKEPDRIISVGSPKPTSKDRIGMTHIKHTTHNTTNTEEYESVKAFSSPLQKPTGVVVYNIPKIMKVRETYQVTVRIGKDNITITENMGGEVVEAIIPLTETMEVKLIDPSPSDHKAFEVVADNEGVQMVDTTGEYTQWSWNVTPIKVGKTSLKIVVSIIKNGNKKEEVYSDDIVVEASAVNQISFFFYKYWQWMLGTLLIPVFKYFWGVWRKRKEEDKPKPKKYIAKKAA